MADEERRPREISGVNALDLAEVKILMLTKKDAVDLVQRMLDRKGVEKPEDFDGLTICRATITLERQRQLDLCIGTGSVVC